MKGRCDQEADCIDESDENGCEIVLIDADNYGKEHAPSNVEKGKPLDILVSLDILMLSEFHEIDFSYKMKFLIYVSWFDSRLLFQNLNNVTFKNIIGKEKKDLLWTPPLIFTNSEKTTMLSIERSVDEPIVNMFVKRSSSAEVAPPTYLDETYLYRGSENTLILRTEYNLKLHCIYDLTYYPFDYQMCSMQV